MESGQSALRSVEEEVRRDQGAVIVLLLLTVVQIVMGNLPKLGPAMNNFVQVISWHLIGILLRVVKMLSKDK